MNTFSLEKTSKLGNLYSNSIPRQYKLDLMSRRMEIKSINQKLRKKSKRIRAKELGYSDSTLERYKQIDIKKVRIGPLRSKVDSKEFKVTKTTRD